MTGYSTTTGNRLTADGTYTYAYDNDGNMTGRTKTSNGEITTFTWDYRNRLTEVLIKSSGGTTLQDDKFTYDVENRRIGKNTLSGGQGWTGYEGANPIDDFNSGGSLTYRYLYGIGIDSLFGRFNVQGMAVKTLWYLKDMLGSVRENVDGSGTVVDSITYDTYGNILAETHPTSGDRFKYTSREWDSEIGQYFYRARYYSPTDGRFDSEDPLGFKAGDRNLFRYVHNTPTNGIDPSGLEDIRKVPRFGYSCLGSFCPSSRPKPPEIDITQIGKKSVGKCLCYDSQTDTVFTIPVDTEFDCLVRSFYMPPGIRCIWFVFP